MLRDIVKNKLGNALILKNHEQASYQTLDLLSSQLAEQLLQEGVTKNTVLPVFVDNSLNTIVFAIACWKVGAIYTPLNPDLPINVLQSMLARLECDYVYTTNEMIKTPTALGFKDKGEVVNGLGINMARSGQGLFSRIKSHKQIAVIIHTSGSTGTPKAACWSEGSVISFFDSYNDTMQYNVNSIGINNGPFYFDIVFQDTFLALFYGAQVVLHDRRFIPSRFVALLNDKQVTHMAIMSSTLKTMTNPDGDVDLKHMRQIMAGGEVGNLQMFEQYERAGITIYNGYGPTENNSLSSRYQFDSSLTKDLIPIGVGFKNVSMVLLGDDGIIKDSQTSGQILLGGNQLMEGYIENLEINRDLFIYLDGKCFYPTGDFGYIDERGQMVFEGRRDRRVKVNGNRFSLTTVYKALIGIDNISYAYVNTAGESENPFIVAAITVSDAFAEEDEKSVFSAIRAELRTKLANFMLPKYLFLIESLPYKPSQKVDEKAIETNIGVAMNDGRLLTATSFIKI